nr:M23 family metallopeptidase [Amycolatopsis antarctica]
MTADLRTTPEPAGRRRIRLAACAVLGLILVPVLSSPSPAARAQGDAGPARFSWPLSPDPPVVRAFEAPEDPFGPGHRGVDLGTAPGASVLAAAEGVVVYAGVLAGRGVVSVDHDGGLRTTYEPLQTGVTAGDRVRRGQELGTVAAGHPECAAQACLHWGVRRGEEYLDPLPLVRTETELRLKPWEG